MSLPIGTIIAWNQAALPGGWALCNGANGTPDLRSRFVYGASLDSDVGNTGGTTSHTHTMPSTSTHAGHTHTGGAITVSYPTTTYNCSASGTVKNVSPNTHRHTTSATLATGGAHSHTIGTTGSTVHLPPYVKRAFIMKID